MTIFRAVGRLRPTRKWTKRWLTALAVVIFCLALAADFIFSRPPIKPNERVAAPTVQRAPDGGRIHYDKGRYPVLTLPDGSHELVRSILNVRKTLQFGGFVWNDDGVPPGPVWIRVDLRNQLLSVFRAGHEIGSSVILYGADIKETPGGVFPVLAKARDYHSITYDAPMPYMLRLTSDGVAIHGSQVREGAATHGCIGVPVDFARRLFGEAKVGDKVAIYLTG